MSLQILQFDEKNIRRRVYDALNVLMALDIISKDRKEIQWKGLHITNVKDMEHAKVGSQIYYSLRPIFRVLDFIL